MSKENWAGVEPKNTRHQLSKFTFDKVQETINAKLVERQRQKGMGTYSSCHEALGILTEEMKEYSDEVHLKNEEGQVRELIDIAVGCIWGIASISEGGNDW